MCYPKHILFLGHFCGLYHYTAYLEIKNKFKPDVFEKITELILKLIYLP